jgi:hypothetical protein
MRLVILTLCLGAAAFGQSFNVTFGSASRIADYGQYSYGDTWYTEWKSDGTIRVSNNDGKDDSGTNSQNIQMFSLAANYQTISNKNTMANLGTLGQQGLGVCSTTYTFKSAGHVSVGSASYWFVKCQNANSPFDEINANVLKTADDYATVCRPEDQTCAAAGKLPTTAMWSGSSIMSFAWPIQYTAGNQSLPASPDAADTYLNILTIDGNSVGAAKMHAVRIAYSDLTASWYDATKYTAWSSGSTFGAFASAGNVQCIIPAKFGGAGTAHDCVQGTDFSHQHGNPVYDANLGSYFTTMFATGTMSIWSAPNFYGPWTMIDAYKMPIQSGATWTTSLAPHFSGFVAASVATVTAGTNTRARIIFDGPFTQGNGGSPQSANKYGLYWVDVNITTSATTTPPATFGGYVSHFPNRHQFSDVNCYALWMFDTVGAAIRDWCPGNAHPILASSGSAEPKIMLPLSKYGMEAANHDWATSGSGDNMQFNYPWYVALPSLGTLSGDYTVMGAGKRTTFVTTNSVFLGASNSADSSKAIEIYRTGVGNTMTFLQCQSVFGTCTSIASTQTLADGNWFTFLFQRSGSTCKLYTSTQLTPQTAACSSASLALSTHRLNSFTSNFDATNFGSYTYSVLGLWTRAFSDLEVKQHLTALVNVLNRRGITVTY